MHKQYVIVEAWIPDMSEGTPEHPIVLPPGEGGGPPGIWPSPGHPAHPIYWPPVVWPPPGRPAHPIAPGGPVPPVDPGYGIPGPPYPGIWPDPGRPAHPIYWPPSIWPDPRPPGSGGSPPGIWGGNDPYPTPPIYFPPPGGGGGGQPPGIWGGNDPYPTPPIYFPPGTGGGGRPPGIWGGNDPYPTPPIYFPPPGGGGGRPPGIWGGANEPFPTPPIYFPPTGGGPPTQPPEVWPPLPIIPPDDQRPQHPEVPDLNAGNWLFVTDGDSYRRAFVPWPLAVTHPDYNPNYPPDDQQPGTWVTVIYGGQPMWAWIPEAPHNTTPPGQGEGGNEQKATAAVKKA